MVTAVPVGPLAGVNPVMARPPVDCRWTFVMLPAGSYVYWITLFAAAHRVAAAVNAIPTALRRKNAQCIAGRSRGWHAIGGAAPSSQDTRNKVCRAHAAALRRNNPT